MRSSRAGRWALFAFGNFLGALGISIITRAGLGTAPLSAPPLVFAKLTGLTMGSCVFFLNVCFFALEYLVQGRKLQSGQWLQLPVTFYFGALIDLTFWMLSGMTPQNYLFALLQLLAGAGLLGFGISLQVRAQVLLLPGDGVAVAIAKRLGKPFGKVKICFDLVLVVLAAAASLIGLRTLYGVREGTLIAAVFVGMVSQFFGKAFQRADLRKAESMRGDTPAS